MGINTNSLLVNPHQSALTYNTSTFSSASGPYEDYNHMLMQQYLCCINKLIRKMDVWFQLYSQFFLCKV